MQRLRSPFRLRPGPGANQAKLKGGRNANPGACGTTPQGGAVDDSTERRRSDNATEPHHEVPHAARARQGMRGVVNGDPRTERGNIVEDSVEKSGAPDIGKDRVDPLDGSKR